MITSRGIVLQRDRDLMRKLTFHPIQNPDFPHEKPTKAFKLNGNKMLIPRHAAPLVDPPTDLVDTRSEPLDIDITFGGKLRDDLHQGEASRKTLDLIINTGGAVLCLDAGFGKTIVALDLISKIKKRTIIIVHKEFLASQWEQRIVQFLGEGVTVGRIQSNRFEIDNDIVICMFQTLCTREYEKNAFDTVGFMVIDEAHHVPAAVFSRALFQLCPRYCLGLSATPDRRDGLQEILHCFMGRISFQVERVVEPGTASVQVEFYESPQDSRPLPLNRVGKVSMAEFINELAESEDRNKFIVGIVEKLEKSRKILILSDRREHCKYFHGIFGDSGGLYLGGMKQADLDESAGKRIIMASFAMAAEGLDIGDLDTVILSTPKTDIRQAIGRCMRAGGRRKNQPLVVDIVDRWGSLSHSMFNKRKKIYMMKNLM